jgi:TonB family protein
MRVDPRRFAQVAAAIFPFDDASVRAVDRRLSIALATSVLIHALTLAALRGFIPTVHTYAGGGVGPAAALQAVLAGPPIELQPMDPLTPEPMIDKVLLAPALMKPVETSFGRIQAPTAFLPGGGPTKAGAPSPEVNMAVGTIADPAVLGSDYVAQLAQRFPNRAAKVPMLIGAPVVIYPRPALEAGIEGRFAAVVTLDALGHITESRLVVEDPLFGPAVLDALKTMQFTPAEFDGGPIPYWAIVEIVFRIGRPGTPDVASAPPRSRVPLPRQPSVGR